LLGANLQPGAAHRFEVAGQLQYHSRHPDLNESLAHADVTRPEIKARAIDVEIENQQLILDRSETRPRVEAFAGYELYSEQDPLVGPEFNHGYIVGLNAVWHVFGDGITIGLKFWFPILASLGETAYKNVRRYG
jgi:hypothetical protein